MWYIGRPHLAALVFLDQLAGGGKLRGDQLGLAVRASRLALSRPVLARGPVTSHPELL